MSETAISKSEMMFARLELFPLLVAKFALDVSSYNKAGLVLVDTIGSMPVQNAMLAIGFHIARLDVSCIVEYIVAIAPDASLSVLVVYMSGRNE